jgi:hypothetical protein
VEDIVDQHLLLAERHIPEAKMRGRVRLIHPLISISGP